jgi:hypothetical protein
MSATVTKLKPKRCPSCGRAPKRSSEQNRRYWALINAISAKLNNAGEHFSGEAWHWWLKQRFIGMDELKLPSGKVVAQPCSSADLETPEFADYMTQCEVWANEHGVCLDE